MILNEFFNLPQVFEKDMTEGSGNIGNQIRAVYQKIYDQGDDAVEFMYYDSPIFAQYWDEYEGDLDSIIAEVEPSELQIILDELQSAAEDQGVAEGHADQQRKVFKKNGQPVGEVGIDRESSPGVGQWYMKYYPTGDDYSGYDSMEEAVADLKHLVSQFKAEGRGDYVPPKEADYGPEYQAMVRRVGQKAKQQEKAKQQQPKAPVRESRRALLKQIIQS